MLAVRFLLWSARTGIIALVGFWSTYLVLYVVAASVPVPSGDYPYYLPAPSLRDDLAHAADVVGRIAAFGTTPTPLAAGIVLASAAALWVGRRAADKLIEQSRPKDVDTVDPDDLSGLIPTRPAASPPMRASWTRSGNPEAGPHTPPTASARQHSTNPQSACFSSSPAPWERHR